MTAKFIVVYAIAFLLSVVHLTPIDENKPFDCPPNEKYYKCSYEVCFKTCNHLVRPIPCPSILANCYHPSCECIRGYLRQEPGGLCIPRNECP